MIHSGSYANYFWLQGPEADLEVLLETHPDVFNGRHVLVTSFDSGPLTLTPEEVVAGWQVVSGAAASPRLPAEVRIPGELYSEWWLYPVLPAWIEAPTVYVNYLGFSVAPSDAALFSDLSTPFWTQVLDRKPESLFLNGSKTILITQRRELLPLLETWLISEAAA